MYPHWKGFFYPQELPQSKWLEFYSSHFRAVEINATFYHSMKKETFLKWRETVGQNFVFAIKGNRYITHIKRLKSCEEELGKFFAAAEGLNSSKRIPSPSLNVILWQLPPGFQYNNITIQQFNNFLKILPKNWRQAFEFRNESWLDPAVYKVLQKFNAAVVFQDYPDWPISEEITADFVYIRLHGKEGLYSSSYSPEDLEEWGRKIKSWRKTKDIYVFFNNDALGYAVENAKTLSAIL